MIVMVRRPEQPGTRLHGNWFWLVYTLSPYKHLAAGFAWTRKGADKKAQRAVGKLRTQ